MIEKLLVTNGIIVIFAAEFRYQKISVCFSPGDNKEVAPRLRKKEAILTAPVDQEEGDDEAESDKQIFMCPKKGALGVFKGVLRKTPYVWKMHQVS